MSIVISGTTGIDAGSLPVSNCGNTEVEGNLNITGAGKRITGDFSNATASNRVAFQTSTLNGATSPFFIPNGTGTKGQVVAGASSDASNSSYISIMADSSTGLTSLNSGASGTGTFLPMIFTTGGSERMRIDSSGNLLLTSGTGALGYGTGAGGTVTQLTSKSTAVTLNKPTGQIIMNNAALASGAEVSFTVFNSLVGGLDIPSAVAFNNASYSVRVHFIISGSFNIAVKNNSGGTLSESLAINFDITKGANA